MKQGASGCKTPRYNFPDSLAWRWSQRRSISLYAGAHVRSTITRERATSAAKTPHPVEDRNNGTRLENQWISLSETCTVAHWQDCCGIKRIGEVILKYNWEHVYQRGECPCVQRRSQRRQARSRSLTKPSHMTSSGHPLLVGKLVLTPLATTNRRVYQQTGHEPWAKPPTKRAVTCRARCSVGQRVLWRACLSPRWGSLARVSISGSAGSGANASDTPAQHRRCDTFCTCDSSHMRVTEKGGDCGSGGNLRVFHFMDGQSFHTCVKTPKRKTMTKTLRSAFRSIECRGWLAKRQRLSPSVPGRLRWREQMPINLPSGKGTLDTNLDDIATTVDASEMHDTTDVGRLTSPLFSQEREASAIPVSVSGLNAQSSVVRPVRNVEPFSSFEKPLSKGERNQELKSVKVSKMEKERILPDQNTFMNSLTRKLIKLLKEKFATQTRLSEAHSELDRREQEKRNADMALFEPGMQLQSKRLELYQENQLTDQTQREKSWPSEEKVMRNIVFQEDRARNWQDVEDLRKFCCAEAERARQLKYDELSTQKGREPFHSKSAYGSHSGIARQGEFLERCKRILCSWNCEQLWIILRSQSTHEYSESQKNDQPRFLLAAWYTELIGYIRTRFWRSTCSRWTNHPQHSSRIPRIWHRLLADWRQVDTGKIAEQREGLRKEPQEYTIPTPPFARKFATRTPLGTPYRRNFFSKLSDEKSEIWELHFD